MTTGEADRGADPAAAPAALAGLRIADFTRILAGPFATMVLGDLGADVIKVESAAGDDTRSWGPPFDAAGRSTYYLAVNRNKSSVVLDLASPDGVAEARRLILEAGIVVENFRPGVMDRLGLGCDMLRDADPSLIYCSISGFGAGAGALLPGFDLILQAVGGLMSVTGQPDGPPQKVGVAVVDVVAGLFAVTGILAAVRHRERTGEGQRVEVNLLTSLLAALVNQAAAYTVAGVVGSRLGHAHPSIAPYELLEAADGALAVAVGNERQFAALCKVLEAPTVLDDARFASNARRVEHRHELRLALNERLGKRGTAEWARLLTHAGVPAGKVNDIAEAFQLATDLGLEPTVTLNRHNGSAVTLPASPLHLSRTPVRYVLAPPDLGTTGD